MALFARGGKAPKEPREQPGSEPEVSTQSDAAAPVADGVDGDFSFDFTDEGVVLTVTPPQGGGKAVEAAQVLARLKRMRLQGLSMIAVSSAVTGMLPTIVAPAQERVVLHEDADIRIADDELTADVTLLPPEEGGALLTRDELVDLLKDEQVVYGFLDDAIDDLLARHPYGEAVVVARGDAPRDGEPGVIEYLTELSHRVAYGDDDGGDPIDFKNLLVYKEIKEGEVILQRLPSTPGVDGRSVRGRALTAKQYPEAVIEGGAGTKLSDDGVKLLAAMDGVVSEQHGKVIVMNMMNVDSDVGIATGNIEFNGDVTIRGDVTTGYVVKATGSIKVFGVVEAATLAAGGDIVVQNGIYGMNKAVITAGGSVSSRFIQNATVQADSLVCESLISCRAACREGVDISKNKGTVRGCTIKAQVIKAKVVGPATDTPSTLQVGEGSDEIIQTLERLTKESQQAQQQIRELERRINDPRTYALDDELAGRIRQLEDQKALLQLEENRDNLKTRIAELEEQRQALHDCVVHVLGVCAADTRVNIGSLQLILPNDVEKSTFKRANNKIACVTYEGG